MNKNFHYIMGTMVLLAFFLNAGAQDSAEVAPPVEIKDTLYRTSTSNNYQFNEVTDASKIDVRTVPQNRLNKLRSDDDYWYVNEAPPREKKQLKPSEKPVTIFDKGWFKTLFWFLLIGGFVSLLVWFLATSNISLFRRKQKPVSEEILAEEETENIFQLNFEKEIQKAIDSVNYRMAVRLMYLRTLRDLSLHHLIQYTHEKTNSDYLFQLAGSTHYKNFFRLTRDFEYTWYGHFPLSQDRFSVIQNDFNNFKQQLS
jgi:hypothetical protein